MEDTDTTPDHHGVVEDGALRFERVFPAPMSDVWEAVTARDRTAAWSFPTDFEPRVGGTLSFDFGAAGSVEGEVIAWEAPEALEYAWDGPGGRWHVRFELEEAGDGHGTVLSFAHLAPHPHDPEYAAGWHWHLDRLAQHLAGEEPARVDEDEHFHELLRLYSQAEG